jgi:hypothetical protein
LAGWRDQIFLERDALVTRDHRIAHPDLSVAIPNRRGDVRNFVTSRFTLARVATEPLERFEEKGLNVVRLKSPRLGAFHLLAHMGNPARIIVS